MGGCDTVIAFGYLPCGHLAHNKFRLCRVFGYERTDKEASLSYALSLSCTSTLAHNKELV